MRTPNTLKVESVMNDYVRLVELESSYQEADGTGALGDDMLGSDDEGHVRAAAGGECRGVNAVACAATACWVWRMRGGLVCRMVCCVCGPYQV